MHLFNRNSFAQHPILTLTIWIELAVFLSFVREFSSIKINYKRTVLNPAQLFVISFLVIIIFGALLLMLPNATHNGISFLDALFTATSAVCVTGLIVVDTSTYFTEIGHVIIMVLIQIGGLGILTFASYFGYFFKGGSSYENQLVLGDMVSSKKLGEVFSILKYILLITFGIEFFAGLFIFFSLDSQYFNSLYDQLFFSAFHSISAFCNAGFSTMTNGLYETEFRFNYFLQMIIILTFVLGGLGFPITVNIVTYIKYRVRKLFSFGKNKVAYRPWALNLNSRITLITTISLSVIAFLAFYIIEYNNTLAEHQGIGKVVTALFGATTPRTAGFNTINTAEMLFPTTILILFLMWVGASPSSTGGGIKTSTLAIATLNILSLAKGKSRIEVFKREIAEISVRRAFATISLSLIVIGLGIVLLTIFDSKNDLMSIAFECFSAYSTVGLSLGITGSLSDASKFVLIAIMFIGRVSVLTIVIAIFKKIKHQNYRYPTEEITIN
ncbi:MAG: ATPase [Cyclobacteriaceae bacterium]|nr:ATPase [Cyclobacteriaceae bacterium]